MKWLFVVFATFLLVFFVFFGIQQFYDYIFPVEYKQEVLQASKKYGVDQAIIFSCINIESRFRKDVVSSKGAVGLMQVKPTTASEMTGRTENDLFDAKTNIDIGTKYLSKMIARFENLETAVASYNAGPTAVQGWLANEEYSSDGKTLQKIPYEETRKYVEKFQKNLKYYKNKLN